MLKVLLALHIIYPYLHLFCTLCICIYKQTHISCCLMQVCVCVCIYIYTHTHLFSIAVWCKIRRFQTMFYIFFFFFSAACVATNHKKEKDKPPTSPTMHLTQGCLCLFLPLRSFFFQGRHLFFYFLFFCHLEPDLLSALPHLSKNNKKKEVKARSHGAGSFCTTFYAPAAIPALWSPPVSRAASFLPRFFHSSFPFPS